jgi:type VI secretion system protein VasD
MGPGAAQIKASRAEVGAKLRTAIVAALLTVTGCAPAAPPPTVVTVQVSATASANATPAGQGAPVAIRVYQLASKSGFEQAEFFPLFNSDTATLGPDLVKKDEFLLAPGGSKSITLQPADTVHAIGVFAAYRDFQHATWRGDADIPAHKTTTVTVTADRPGITLAASPGQTASP